MVVGTNMAKKKILLLSDDLRMSSGVGTMSREFVVGTLDRYDWVQIGGAIKHPEEGNVVDLSEAISKDYVKVFSFLGFNSPIIDLIPFGDTIVE